jgi:hypothetical protein
MTTRRIDRGKVEVCSFRSVAGGSRRVAHPRQDERHAQPPREVRDAPTGGNSQLFDNGSNVGIWTTNP